MDAILKTIRDRLHPEPYSEAAEEVDGISLLLIGPASGGAKYALAVVPYQSRQPALAQVGRARRAVDAFTDASIFSKNGLIILFVAPEPDWPAPDAAPAPDRHGLRRTIVQALVWLDPRTGKYRMNRSRWGPLKFGNLHGHVTALCALLDAWPLTGSRS